jgi:hypothetical protein
MGQASPTAWWDDTGVPANLLDTAATAEHDGMSPHAERRPTMTDHERDHLLQRLAESERARRRWKVLALVGTPALAVLLVMMAAFGTSSYLALRDALRRENEVRNFVVDDLSQSLTLVESNAEPEKPARMPHESEP